MIVYPVGSSMDLNPFSSVGKFECVVCLLIVAGCWGDCTYQLQKNKIEVHELPKRVQPSSGKKGEILHISTLQPWINFEE